MIEDYKIYSLLLNFWGSPPLKLCLATPLLTSIYIYQVISTLIHPALAVRQNRTQPLSTPQPPLKEPQRRTRGRPWGRMRRG